MWCEDDLEVDDFVDYYDVGTGTTLSGDSEIETSNPIGFTVNI